MFAKKVIKIINVIYILQLIIVLYLNKSHHDYYGGGAWWFLYMRTVISRVILVLLSYSIIRLVIYYSKPSRKALGLITALLLIPVSLILFYCSGQSIGIVNGYGYDAKYGLICEDFDSFLVREINVGDFPWNKHGSNFATDSNHYVYRNLAIDSVPSFATYTNKFFFRDFYLTKDRKFRVFRGLGFACNLPDEAGFLLKK